MPGVHAVNYTAVLAAQAGPSGHMGNAIDLRAQFGADGASPDPGWERCGQAAEPLVGAVKASLTSDKHDLPLGWPGLITSRWRERRGSARAERPKPSTWWVRPCRCYVMGGVARRTLTHAEDQQPGRPACGSKGGARARSCGRLDQRTHNLQSWRGRLRLRFAAKLDGPGDDANQGRGPRSPWRSGVGQLPNLRSAISPPVRRAAVIPNQRTNVAPIPVRPPASRQRCRC